MDETYEKKISILVPTNRPYNDYVSKLVNSIVNHNPLVDYEICIYSNQKIEGPNIVWYEEIGKTGPIYGFNFMVKECKGEYVVCVTDDHELHTSIDVIYDFMKTQFNENDEFIVSSLSCGDGGCKTPGLGQTFGESVIEWDETYPIIRFPIFHKKTIKKLGNVIFNDCFFYHAADNWLGFYLGKNGYIFKECPALIIPHNQQTDFSFIKKDCETSRKLMKELTTKSIEYNYMLD
jgi:hypothetical protein